MLSVARAAAHGPNQPMCLCDKQLQDKNLKHWCPKMSPACPCLYPQWVWIGICCPISKEEQLQRNSAALTLLLQALGICCWWLILLPFPFLPVGSTTPGKSTQQRPHNCTLADLLENELPFQVLLCQLRAANDLFPAQSMETCAEDCDVCREGSDAPVV